MGFGFDSRYDYRFASVPNCLCLGQRAAKYHCMYLPEDRQIWLYCKEGHQIWRFWPEEGRQIWPHLTDPRQILLLYNVHMPEGCQIWLHLPEGRQIWLYWPEDGRHIWLHLTEVCQIWQYWPEDDRQIFTRILPLFCHLDSLFIG